MAGRIPQNFIDDLLTRTDIIDVIDGYVSLKKAGRNHQALCPFHTEKTPSFSVSQEKQFYHCFGCGANGTAITFLMDYAGMDFVEAIEDLASRAGVEVPRDQDTTYKKSNQIELYELMELVVRFYCRQLREHSQAERAINYLKKRGLSGELAAEFELGFAPPGWDNLINSLGGSDASLRRLTKTGMILKKEGGGYYDRFRDRIIFPIRDQRGRVIGIGGRVLNEDTPKYLNSPETPIFHKGRELYGLYQAHSRLKVLDRLYIVEGYMDVLALAQFDIRNVVATLGTAVTTEHMERLFRTCSQLVFCFDGDAAGQKAAWRTLEITLPLLRDSRQCYFMLLPDGEDPDSYVRTQGREKIEDISTYVPLTDFLFDRLKQNIDLTTREGRALLTEKSIPYLQKFLPGALLELLLKDIAAHCKLTVPDLKGLLSNKKIYPVKNPRKINRTVTKHSDASPVEKAIRLLIQQPNLTELSDIQDELVGIEVPGMNFFHDLISVIKDSPDITTAGILEHWRNSKYEQRLNKLAIMENTLTEQHEIEAEFLELIGKIKRTHEKEQRLARSSDINTLDELRNLYSRLPTTTDK